jgi:hypothetical protein
MDKVRCRLESMQLYDELVNDPANFLSQRKNYGICFAQWCHYNHLQFSNGTSADFFRIGRPYGVYPLLYQAPSFRTRYALMMLLSCWRWGLTNGVYFPTTCLTCCQYNDSPHLLFDCQDTLQLRRDFEATTGRIFDMDAFAEESCSEAVVTLCERLCHHIAQCSEQFEQAPSATSA